MVLYNTSYYTCCTKTLSIDISRFDSPDEYNVIINAINEQYNIQNRFVLEIETIRLSRAHISMYIIYEFSNYLISLKRRNPQYLVETTIKIYNNTVYDLLYYLFIYLSQPVANVKVILYNESNDIEKIKYYFP
jgi:hypothetical protein